MDEPDALMSLKQLLSKKSESGTKTISKKSTARFKKLRELAKIHFSNGEYTDAIDAYSSAIAECEFMWRCLSDILNILFPNI